MPLSDGGKILIEIKTIEQENLSINSPFLLIVPGVTGDNKKLYVRNITNEALTKGFNVVFINYRG